MIALHTDPLTRRALPNMPVFLFRPLSVSAGLGIVDLSSDEWSEITPPAHVVAQIGGGK